MGSEGGKARTMLKRLQRKTLIPAQIVGYAATLLVGVTIVMLSVQLYADIRPVLTQQSDVFRNHAVTLNKTVSTLNSLDKQGIYFSADELADIAAQPFVKNVAPFRSSSFSAYAAISLGPQTLRTDLFFESIPDEYIDVRSDQWHWDPPQEQPLPEASSPSLPHHSPITPSSLPQENPIPIIIPEDYLNLYNFGFAESQALPVISQGAIESVVFSLRLSGRGRTQTFVGHIVGFSGKINTILVPDSFLRWANETFGDKPSGSPSRLLVEFSDASDARIPAYIESHGYTVKQDELENSKMIFFFHLAILFVIVVALIIIVLSVAFIIMSLNVIVQRNRDLFCNLYNIGYAPRQIARYYQRIVALITVADIAVAAGLALLLRKIYIAKLATLFTIDGSALPLLVTAALTALLLAGLYALLILRTIRKTVEPSAPPRLP